MAKRFFVEVCPRTTRDGNVQEVWASGDEDLAGLLSLTSGALKKDVARLYHSKTMNQILSVQDISNLDTLVATTSFDLDPFEGVRGQGVSEPVVGGEIATVKISILGMPRIGKSALALRFCVSDFLANYETTIEEEFERRIVVGGVTIDVSVLDTAGQEAFQALRSNWIKGRDAFVLGFSVENPNLAELKEFSDLIALYGETKTPPIALVATKIDLLKTPGASNHFFDSAQKLAQENGWMFFRTSAMGNIGVKEAFEALVCKVVGISQEGPFSPGGRGDPYTQNDSYGPDGAKEIPGLVPCPPLEVARPKTDVKIDKPPQIRKQVDPPEVGGGCFSRLTRLLCG